MQLASRFGKKSPILRQDSPLSDDQIARVAPSIFAVEAHDSRSERYTYIPTVEVLTALRSEGFQPFMVAQTKVRDQSRRDFTKHMIRLRHANDAGKEEANEIILLNSHDGTSSYQLLAGMFRFVCANGMVCGDIVQDVRIRHKGDVAGDVVEGAYEVLDGFGLIRERKETMQSITLTSREQEALATAALTLRYDDATAAPITESQILRARRSDDNKTDLWATFNRMQENMTKGGIRGRTANGRRTTTREIQGIDQDVKLNRALWKLAEGMAAIKA